MSDSALDRTNRALDLIPFITRNPGWSISELAERFNTSPGQILKDLEMLFMCGLPGYSHLELIDLEIDSDYVAVKNPQNLAKPRNFNYSEVVALSLGLERLTPQILDEKLRARAESLQKRFRAFLADQPAPPAVISPSPELTEIDLVIANTIRSDHPVEIEYRSARSDVITKRTIFPRETYLERGHRYTIAFCELAQEVRHFRHDRILSAVPVENEVPRKPPLESRPGRENFEVHVKLAGENRFFVEENPRIISKAVNEEDHILVIFEIDDPHWLIRALIALPGSADILAPLSFRELYLASLDAILELYR